MSKLLKLFIITIGFTIVLLGLYIFQVFLYNSHLKNLANLQKTIDKLSQENKTLKLHITSYNNLSNISTLAEMLNFEKISQVNYLKIPKRNLAAK